MTTINTNGVILYEGPSLLDGSPIVVIMTGLDADSENGKTGAMLQTFIIRSDIAPMTAARIGADRAICGNCPHRGRYVEFGTLGAVVNVDRTCYVDLSRSVTAVYHCYIRGGYAYADDSAALAAGRIVRAGTYGDPAAAPVAVWHRVLSRAAGWTGYSHQWRTRPALRRYCMASVDSDAEALEARARGWRTFRVAAPGNTGKVGREMLCPASEEAGRKTTCDTCRLCAGASSTSQWSVMIPGHGSAAIKNRLAARA